MSDVRNAFWVLWPIVVGGVAVMAFSELGSAYLEDYRLDLGSQALFAVREAYFVLIWTPVGMLAAVMFALTFARFAVFSEMPDRIVNRLIGASDRTWVIVGAILATAAAVLIRHQVLHGAPLTDDESCYQFASELLAGGRLRVESPPLKLFFDRTFMINDGHLYPLYFVGWPALMLPGTLLGVPGYMAAVYYGLTVPAVFLVARRLLGPVWARVAVIVYFGSPMMMMSAATQMSHPACTFALAWMTWFLLEALSEESRWWSHFGLAMMFSVAFFVRPQSTLGFGFPLLVWWVVHVLGRSRRTNRVTRLVSFLVPSSVMAFLFLMVNRIQNGSWFKPGYVREVEYSIENKFRFSGWRSGAASKNVVAHVIMSRPLAESVANTLLAILRLNHSIFGWPFSLLFAFFSGRGKWQAALWSTLGCYCAVHFFVTAPGIDSFGPTHYAELGWPIVLLTVFGLRGLTQWFGAVAGGGDSPATASLRRLPVCMLVALLVLSFSQYLPLRLQTLARIAADVHVPTEAVRQAGIHNAVIFAPRPFSPRPLGCKKDDPNHWVFWRPNNDPWLKNDILWVNHLGMEKNRQLLRHFPKRKGYVFLYDDHCRIRFYPVLRDKGSSSVLDPRLLSPG